MRQAMADQQIKLPPSVIAAGEEYRISADPMRAFIDEKIELDPDEWLERRQLFHIWSSWAEENGHKPGSTRKFHPAFRTAIDSVSEGAITEMKKNPGLRGYTGISLIR